MTEEALKEPLWRLGARGWHCALALALLMAGCAPAEGPDPSHDARSTALVQRPAATGRVDLEQERLLKLSEAGPLAAYPPIDPVATRAFPPLALASAPREARHALAEVDLPVLLPDDVDLLAVLRASAGGGWYAASMTRDGHNVYLHGSRIALRLPGPLEPTGPSPTWDEPRLTRNERSPVLTFDAGGAAYALIVECDAPDSDPRCTGDDYVRDLADRLGRFEEVTP